MFSKISCIADDKYTFPLPEKRGYRFIGWKLEGEENIISSSTETFSHSFNNSGYKYYSEWEPLGISVSFYFGDELVENPVFQDLIKRITDFSKDRKIIGYHYTRADKDDILKGGLKSRTGQEIRETFLSRYGELFTAEELDTIKNAWKAYFNKNMISCRDYRIFFNLTTTALFDSGAEPLLQYYGGEQVYMPLKSFPSIAKKIQNIGSPLLIKATLNPCQLKLFDYEDIAS